MVADALIAGGFKTAAKNFVETVRSILSHNPSFAFMNGEFGLAEWYPGRKPGAKKRVIEAEEYAEAMAANPDDPSTALALLSEQ